MKSGVGVLLLGIALTMPSAKAVQVDRGGGDLDLVGGANQPLRLSAASDCAANSCVLQTRTSTRVGLPISINPSAPSSKLLLECSFQAHIQIVREANTIGNFQLQELTPGGPVNLGIPAQLYTVLSSFGAGVGAPVTLRALIPRAGNRQRSFALAASTSGYNVTPLLTISDKVCTITEISN